MHEILAGSAWREDSQQHWASEQDDQMHAGCFIGNKALGNPALVCYSAASFHHLIIQPLAHRVHLTTHSPPTGSFAHLLTRWPTHPLARSPSHSLAHSPTHPLAHSPTRSLDHRSLAHTITCLLSYLHLSVAHLLTLIQHLSQLLTRSLLT